MPVIVGCDNCGCEVKEGSICSMIIVLPPSPDAAPVQGGFMLDPQGSIRPTKGQPAPERHEFVMCGECAAALALAMHTSAKKALHAIREARN